MKWNGEGVLKIGSKTYRKGKLLPADLDVKKLCRVAQAGIVDDSGKPLLKFTKKKDKKDRKKGV